MIKKEEDDIVSEVKAKKQDSKAFKSKTDGRMNLLAYLKAELDPNEESKDEVKKEEDDYEI